ncbi:MAG: hypothetical protein AAFX99_00890 [Myxococcota bacterium]
MLTHSPRHMLFAALLAGFASSLMTCITLVSYQVWADGDEDEATLPSGFAYNGYLDQNGTPFDGLIGMTFRLYAVEEGGNAFWQETQEVRVYSGHFSVLLAGSGANPLPASAFRDSGPWLEVSINATPLSSRQQIHAVPASLWSQQGHDFFITGRADINSDLAVGGDAAIGGTLAVDVLAPEINSGITVNSSMHITETLTASAFSPSASTLDPLTGSPGVYNDNNAVVVLGQDDHVGGPRQVRLQENVAVQGNLAVGGRLKSGNVDAGMEHRDCYWENALPQNPALDPNNTFHSGTCLPGFWMVGWRCRASDRLDDSCALHCCRP